MVLETPNDNDNDDGGGRFPVLGRFRNTANTIPPSHNNSQHVLAILYGVGSEGDSFSNAKTDELILQAFSKTSALPCDVWVYGNGTTTKPSSSPSSPSILLASNYPNCILESHNFCVLSAGFPYHYRDAFANHHTDSDSTKDASHPPPSPHNPKSFARTILDYCEALIDPNHPKTSDDDVDTIAELVGVCLKKVSGHFSLFLVRKTKEGGFWAWNDPFGFLPVYHHHHRSSDTIVLSSHWDCLVPAIRDAPSSSQGQQLQPQLQLDWDSVAEYLTLGTTLGGMPTKEEGGGGSQRLDRTLVRGIENLRPGTCLSLEKEIVQIRRYISCYGACEEVREPKPKNQWMESPTKPANRPRKATGSKPNHRIRGVKLAKPKTKKQSHGENKKNLISPLPSSEGKNIAKDDDDYPVTSASSELLLCEIVQAISSCIEQAMAQGHVGRAALTGGGDTRLILACLLLLQEQQQNSTAPSSIPEITFQTHSKQRTDWQIARHLASTFGLKHEHIRATATTLEGSYNLFQMIVLGTQEMLLSNLHDQTPLRRKQKKAMDQHKESILSYTLHGRFGTEFLGCLCFDKSPLDIRQEEIEGFRPKANRWLEAIFGSTASASSLQNPVDTLSNRFRELEEDKIALQEALATASAAAPSSTLPFLGLDTAYAFQLQLYTRSCLSDIYKGLRGGSWFSIPTAQFSRNAITPFLDNALLRLLLCHVSVRDKEEPYELYGKVYTINNKCNKTKNNSNEGVMDILRRVPSNNKLLCNHTGIPRAIKAPEATARPYLPQSINASKSKKTNPGVRRAMEELRERFHPVFWKGAIAIFERAPVKMDPVSVGQQGCIDRDVGVLIERIGNPHDACLLSGRLQSFLLWHERRFLVHCHD